MSRKTGPCRALVAFGLRGTATILATDNIVLAEVVEHVSDDADDVGVEAYGNYPAGVYLFEGEGFWTTYLDQDGYKDSRLEFEGTTRPVDPAELAGLLGMRPEPAREGQA